MSRNPYKRIQDARAEIVAASMAGAHDLITSTVPDVTSIRFVNNNEDAIYWSYRTNADPDGEWIDIFDQIMPDGSDLADALYDETNGIDLRTPYEIEPYLLVQVGPEVYGYGPSMPVDKYTGQIESAELDPEKMRTACQSYEKGYDEDLSAILLVYVDEAGGLHEQPLADITDVGTLIDPESGDDMALVGWKYA